MPAGITSASARGGYAQGGIGSERAGRPLRLSCQLVVGAQGVAYVAMKVALNSAVRPSLPHHQRLSVHPQKILGVHVARFESSSVASPRLPLRRASFGGLLASGQINRARGRTLLLARAYLSNAHAAGEVAIGEAHPRAAEAAVIGLLEMEARLERHALERRANCLASDPERPRRVPPAANGLVAGALPGPSPSAMGR